MQRGVADMRHAGMTAGMTVAAYNILIALRSPCSKILTAPDSEGLLGKGCS